MDRSIILNPAVQTAKHAEYAKGKGVESKSAFSRWESVFLSNPFCFRVVRVFRGSNCFFQVHAKQSHLTRGSAKVST